VKTSLDILAGHCADAGRDLSEIELTVSFPTIIRDRVEDAEAARANQLAHNGLESLGGVPLLTGSPETIVEALRPYVALGFSTVIARMPAPFDRETIERLPEVVALLSA
jgi:alkanesulfonate monooxygenase SsuD/methylene tetrahydromethanopterin reductase-like flavin-dependent oxidoreductase (luciferase family)